MFSCEFSSRLVAYLLGYQVDDLVMVPQTLEITKLKLARVRDNAMLKLLLQVVDVVCTHPCLKNILVQEVWMATFQKVFFFPSYQNGYLNPAQFVQTWGSWWAAAQAQTNLVPQAVQRCIRCCQSKFLFRFSNLPLPASACRKVANRNPRCRRNLKICVLKVSSSFPFSPLQISTVERVRSTLNPNFPESLKSNSCIWCLSGWFLFLMNLLPFLNYFTHVRSRLIEGVRVIKKFPQLFTRIFFLKSHTTSWTSERRAEEAGKKKGANQSRQKES